MYTLAKCRKYVPGFGLPAFKADVLRVYEDACAGIARGHRTLLRQVGPQPCMAASQCSAFFCMSCLHGHHRGGSTCGNVKAQQALYAYACPCLLKHGLHAAAPRWLW